MRQDGVSVKGFPLVEVRELTVNDEVRPAPAMPHLARVRHAVCGSVRGELRAAFSPARCPSAPARSRPPVAHRPPPAAAALRLIPGPASPRRSIVDGRWHLSGTGWAGGWV